MTQSSNNNTDGDETISIKAPPNSTEAEQSLLSGLMLGLVHVSNMKKDYFMFDRSKRILIGERTKKIIRIGDQLNIKVLSVDLNTRNPK